MKVTKVVPTTPPPPEFHIELTQDELIHLTNLLDILVEESHVIGEKAAQDDAMEFFDDLHCELMKYDHTTDHSKTFRK